MNYYKLINGDEFIGICTSHDMRRYQQKHSIILACTEDNAEYVQVGDSLYSDSWLNPVVTHNIEYKAVMIIAIDKTEYDTLLNTIETGEEITVDTGAQNPEPVPDVYQDPADTATIEYVRAAKTSEMSTVCNNIITGGVDITLSDGLSHHFSMSIEDQFNLLTSSILLSQGQQVVPYHADGEPCTFFTPEDFQTIMTTCTAWKTYHESYFNSLRGYIESLDDIHQIAAIQYGDEIPFENQSVVLKHLLISQNTQGAKESA